MEERKTLVWTTAAVALLIFCGIAVYQTVRMSAPVSMQTEGFPSIGKMSAKIEVVLVEDFQCRNCRVFSQKIIPKIQSHYIKPGLIRFTLVPVSFLAGSQAIANAALEVYEQNPKLFFPYLKNILNHEGDVLPKDLIRLARRIGGIDVDQLKSCIQSGCHNGELEKNLNWARGVMGSQFRTPALFVNGVPASTYSFEAIQYQVDQILGKP
ncbi:MAG: thioredoxin domain-containing protein [Chlamydiales bacterium]